MANADRNRLLANAIRMGREELADLEPDDIPHKLRPVARSTGRGLPRPLQRSLLDFIGANEEFRASLLARFENSGIDDPLTTSFLSDPVSAEALIVEQLEAAESEGATKQLAAANAAVADLEERLGVAKRRLDAQRVEHDYQMQEQNRAAHRAREGLEHQLRDSLGALAGLQRENEALSETVRELESVVSELRDRLARREDRDTRRREALKKDRSGAQLASLPSDPLALARHLDELERKLHFYRDPSIPVTDVAPTAAVFSLPGGVSPESAEAVEFILELGPETILVDGYNVAGVVSSSSIGSRDGRDDAIARAEALKRRSPGSEVIVVFDAAESGGRGGFQTRDGVLVEFEPTTTADDAIVEFVHGGAERCVVFTNDRELQTRSARKDCLVLFSTALITWTEHLNRIGQ